MNALLLMLALSAPAPAYKPHHPLRPVLQPVPVYGVYEWSGWTITLYQSSTYIATINGSPVPSWYGHWRLHSEPDLIEVIEYSYSLPPQVRYHWVLKVRPGRKLYLEQNLNP